MKRKQFILTTLLAATSLVLAGCGKKDGVKKIEIRMKGSDTMIQLGTAWAEAYRKVKPNVFVNANGGGTGTGFAALQNNTTDVCMASREIKGEEKEKTKAATTKDVIEHTVAFDALAVYTHPSNPMKEISIEELTEIWAEGGTIDTWDKVTTGVTGKMVLVGRQNNSGTYDYFREHICGKTPDKKQREFRQGVSELNGSSEVCEQIGKTPTAIGYSGMGYKTPHVNWLKVSKKKGEPGVEPGANAARDKSYPIARGLYLYTAGEATGETKEFLDWIKGPEGQAIVNKEGFVSLK